VACLSCVLGFNAKQGQPITMCSPPRILINGCQRFLPLVIPSHLMLGSRMLVSAQKIHHSHGHEVTSKALCSRNLADWFKSYGGQTHIKRKCMSGSSLLCARDIQGVFKFSDKLLGLVGGFKVHSEKLVRVVCVALSPRYRPMKCRYPCRVCNHLCASVAACRCVFRTAVDGSTLLVWPHYTALLDASICTPNS
jgi:hypothetical protein